MNNDGRTTSEQLYIPNLLIVGGSQSLLLRCFHASKTMGLAIKACTPAEAAVITTRRHPIAIVVPNDVFASSAYDLVALARDVRSALLPVDPEVSVRELEAMIAAAVDGGFSQRERRGGAGRYSIVDGIEDEAPFSRRTLPPESTRDVRQSLPGDGRSSVPPSVRQSSLPAVRQSSPPEARQSYLPGARQSVPAVRQSSTDVRAPLPPSPGVASTRPSAPPASVRPSMAPVSVRPSMAPVSVRVPAPPVSTRAPAAPVSVRASEAPMSTRAPSPPVSVRPSETPAPVGPSVVSATARPPAAPSEERTSVVPVSRTQPSMPAVTQAEITPPSGVQKVTSGAFAAIRSVFSSRR